MIEKNNAKYAFYYLLSLVALVFVAISVGLIAFGIINKTIADALALEGYSNFNNQFKFAISALFIAAPIFYFISNLIDRGLKKQELDQDSGIRRWLTYFILFVSSLIILGVLIGVINNFLSGELTTRFVLKALAVFIIAATTFSFYFYDIKREDATKPDKVIRIFFFASIALVLAAFVAAWFFVESPREARSRRLDQILINNIYSLESVVNSYYERYGALPESLADLQDDQFYLNASALVDPETGVAIVYNRLDAERFEFCADFRTSSFDNSHYPSRQMMGSKDHEAGYQCLPGTLWNKVKPVTEIVPEIAL